MIATRALLVAVLGAVPLLGPAQAGEAEPVAGYTRTGETENCLQAHNIQQSRILDADTILFEMSGGDRYLSETEGCHLHKTYTLSYDATINQLCTTTIVTLLDMGGGGPQQVGSCGLGKFQKLAKAAPAP
ncbi:MAG: hypothetical protein IT548_08105 [Alphaproteobacteria bacterium]|nr:hypothetical protein [Alphaproteobacteria bacterium]